MALDSWTALKASIADWLNKTNLTAVIPDLIALCEADLGRPLLDGNKLKLADPVFDEVNTQLTLDEEIIDLPTTCLAPRSLYLNTTTFRGTIDIVPEEQLPVYTQRYGTTGVPRAAAVIADGTQLKLAPVPDTAYAAEFSYGAKLLPLGASQSSNWVLANHPDVYLWGSLKQAAKYLKGDERIPVWETDYIKARMGVDALAVHRKYGGNTLVARPRQTLGEVR